MTNNFQNDNAQEEEPIVSKTTIKKEMLELKQLGDKIVALSENQLKKIPLDEKLSDAVMSARKITKHGGRKRQMQYIGKLMRHVDSEPIRAALDIIENGYAQDNKLFHLKEQWRDELLIADKEKLTAFYQQFPDVNLQLVRQLIRNHKNAKTDDKKIVVARQVFKLVSEQIDKVNIRK